MITQTLYYIFIYPMQTLLGSVFEWLYGITHSYGWSIILLSLLINVFLLKLTNLSESKARAISVLKAACDTKIAEFKKVFKGAELHAYTQTLFKQKHYHPIYNLASLGGLALQIPFFLGVLFLLQDFEGLEGAYFGIIGDLSKPDTLLFGYALLPFVMSILSLVNVFVSSKELGARIQGGLIALIFLVLLYAMPSALVLYWTMSMVFWLVKTLWKKRSVLRDKSGNLHSDFRSFASSKLPQSLECQQSNSDSVARSESNHTDSVEVSESKTIIESKHALDSQTPTQTASNAAGFAMRNWDFLSGVEGATLSGSDRTQREKKHDLSRKANARSILYNIFTPYKDLDSKTYLTYRNISIFALLNIFFLIFVFSPFAVYSSDVSQFDPSQTFQTLPSQTFQTLGGLFGFFLLFSFLGIYTTSFFYHTRLLKLGVYGVSVILCIGLVYTFVLVGDYGALDGLIFHKLSFSDPNLRLQKYILFFLTLFGSMIFVWLTLRYLGRVFKITFIAFAFSSSVYGIEIINQTAQTPNIAKANDQDISIPFENEFLSYSKTDKNIVIFLLDAFSGSHIPSLFNQFPDLKEQFDGFTLFDNAVSSADGTVYVVATLIGGEYYTTYNIHKKNGNLPEYIVRAFGETGLQFAKNGYKVDFLINESRDFDAKTVMQAADNKIFTLIDQTVYRHLFINKHNLHEKFTQTLSKIKNFDIIRLYSFGLFKFSPELLFRPRIYRDGYWLFIADNDFTDEVANIVRVMDFASTLYATTHYNNTNATKPTFKFIHTLMSHPPFGAYYQNGQCHFYDKRTAWNDIPQKATMNYPDTTNIKKFFYQHYDMEACALSYLGSYIQWLKDSGIYDNTQIYIVSDHAGADSIGISIDSPYYGPDILLLVKDFNSRGALKIDSRLMANYDIAGMFCENLPQGCPNVESNILKHYPKQREIIHTMPDFQTLVKTQKVSFKKLWKVKDNIYNPANWQDITNTESKER